MNTLTANDKSTEEYIKAEIARISEHLKDRIFKITKKNSLNFTCIDGRDEDRTRPSIPGAGLGALAVVLAYFDTIKPDVNRALITQQVKEFFGGSLTGHTQDHGKQGHRCQGCGHAHRIITQRENYSLSKDSSMILESESNKIEPDILTGGHEERAVIIVNTPGFGVVGNDSGIQYFIYNKASAEELYRAISLYLEETLKIKIDQEKILKIADQHFMTTGGVLAEDKNVYTLEISEQDTNKLSYAMHIPKQNAA